MGALKQVVAITWMNLCNLPQRAGNSLVVVIGIGGVVAVLVGALAMAAGPPLSTQPTSPMARKAFRSP